MEEAISDIKRVSEEFCGGDAPTWREMEEHGNYNPETYTIRNDCNWNDLIEDAGLDVNREKSKEEWTKEEVIEEIQRVSEEGYDGEVPPSSEISASYSKFGSWEDICREAGFEETRSQRLQRSQISKGEIREKSKNILEEEHRMPKSVDFSQRAFYRHYESINDLLEDIGIKQYLKEEMKRISSDKTPTREQMANRGMFNPYQYQKFFGSWNKALDECGFERRKVGRYISDEELKGEFKRVSEEYCEGEPATVKHIEEYGEYMDSTYYDRFGTTWEDVILECGYDQEDISESRFSEIPDVTDEEVIDKIQECAKKYDCEEEGPTQDEFCDFTGHSTGGYLYHTSFGSWNEALLKGGFTGRVAGFPEGEKHPFWKGGVGNYRYYGRSWYQKREEASRRDNDSCRICGEKPLGQSPHVHHITPVRYWSIEKEHGKMNHLRNLICLCPTCHSALEGKFKGRSHEEFEELAKEYMNVDDEAMESELKDNIFAY